ncbi:MAG: matrixin family metalloprotease [Nitrospirae bacterium]|nr:matrixin family metalloprotease [Nitrospirota bacterium]
MKAGTQFGNLIIETQLSVKSLLTSLCQREKYSPLWQRGERGDFSIKYKFNFETLKMRIVFLSIALFLLLNSSALAYVINQTGGNYIKWASGSMTYKINSTDGPSGSSGQISSAATTWSNVATSTFNFVNGGATSSSNWGSNNGENIIVFLSFSDSCASTLGINQYWYNPGTGSILDSDIKFNTDCNLTTDGSGTGFDVQSLALHELGHSLSLGHTSGTVMNSTLMEGSLKRNLTSDDRNGISAIYPSGTPPTTYTLTISKSGSGSVTSSPSGINCGFTCSHAYDQGTVVTLTATPSSGYTFSSWSGGGCSGTGQCVVTMNSNTTVTATFASSGSCTYSISPLNRTFDSAGGSDDIHVTAGTGCAWTATSSSSWITVTSGNSGTGNGTVYYSVSANNELSSRSANMTAAGQTFTVTQSGIDHGSLLTPVYRFNNSSITHFYTVSETEKNNIISTMPSFIYEGIAFYTHVAPDFGAVPVYRFNNSSITHFYTISETEKNNIISTMPSFTYEGIAFYASPSKD